MIFKMPRYKLPGFKTRSNEVNLQNYRTCNPSIRNIGYKSSKPTIETASDAFSYKKMFIKLHNLCTGSDSLTSLNYMQEHEMEYKDRISNY